MRGHCYDALVGLAGCDKSLPGIMMAMVRLDVPAVFMYGGSILPGRFRGKDVTVQDVFEAVGRYAAGTIDEAELHALECVACPSAGSCGGQFTANTMACVSEALGLALPGSAGAPAPYESRDAYAVASGEDGHEAFRIADTPAPDCDAQVSGECRPHCGLLGRLDECRSAFARHRSRVRPQIRSVRCGRDLSDHPLYWRFETERAVLSRRTSMRSGGVPVLMKALLEGGYLHGDCLTCTGKTIAENLEQTPFPTQQEVVRPTSRPITPTGGVVGLRGSLAPEGAIVKVAGVGRTSFRGPARVFDTEEACFQAVQGRHYQEGDVLVIRYEGPKGGPRYARDAGDNGGSLRSRHGR